MHTHKIEAAKPQKRKKGHGLFLLSFHESNELLRSVIGGETRKL